MNTDNLGRNLTMLAAVLILLIGIFAVWKSKCGGKCGEEPVKVAEAVNAPVVIYSIPNCSFCKRAKALLDQKGIVYKDVDVSNDEAMREKLVEMTGGRTTVPQIFIHGQSVGGFTDIEKLNNEGKLEEMIAAAPAAAATPSDAGSQPAATTTVPETPYTPEPAPTTDAAAPGVVEGEPAGVVNADQPNPEDLPAGTVDEGTPESAPELPADDAAPQPLEEGPTEETGEDATAN